MSDKSIKTLAKEAKKRLKSGFWQKQIEESNKRKEKAVMEGVAVSKVIEYNLNKTRRLISSDDFVNDEQRFYDKVKSLLDEFGESDDMVGRLIDKEYFETLSYEQKQRYMLFVSDKYLSALSRYRKEKALEIII